jgi:hypothetical protein
MTEDALRLKEQLLALSFDDQLELFRVLEESVCPPDPYADMTDDEWIAELNRRSADADAGRDVCEVAFKVIEELRAECGRDEPE